ncbi:MAG: TfoX/Sxy family protein [Burkholderiales bacterium]|jgi:DNA transformation protein|nr:TfoX/Sxy family protein [Burkholderiales bacterium]
MLRNDCPLKGLANIGTTIADRFSEVGISTVGDLRRVGVVQAYQMVRSNNPDKHIPVCYYLYSLEGALRGVHWNALPEQTKLKLKVEAGL